MSTKVTYQQIKSDKQVKKFCMYGFLKNLKFFEAYLILYLLSHDISLFQIGILLAVREAIINIFEIPSGFIADYVGRKKELYLCFGFYMMAFLAFFYSDTFTIALVAMVFYGLGEAFRSGTHKAMIYTYLDCKEWTNHKAFVYGRTRSFSLIGSAVSSLAGIVLVLVVPDIQYIFLFSIVPYILDLLLIMSYPSYLDYGDKNQDISVREMFQSMVEAFRKNKKLRGLLLEEGCAEGTYSYTKDFIQPIMEMIIIGSGVMLIGSLSVEDNLKVILGLIYAVLNLCGSVCSKKAYLLTKNRTGAQCLMGIHVLMIVVFGVLGVFTQNYFVVFLAYVVLYILHSVRKPIFVEEVDDHIEKSMRATVFSISAQLKSLFLILFAPLAGFVGDRFGIHTIMLMLSVFFVITIPLLNGKSRSISTEWY